MDESFAAPDVESHLKRAQKYCVSEVKKFDPDRYLTALVASQEQRNPLFALFAFNLELAKICESVSEPMLGRIRLQWWRESISEVYKGTPREHGVITALVPVIKRYAISRKLFEEMFDAREFDLERRNPKNLSELLSYAGGTSGILFKILANLCNSDQETAYKLGVTWAIIGLMKSISFHQAQGRCYLPGIPLNSLGSDEALSSYKEVLRVGADFLAEIPKENDTVLNLYRWIAEYDLRQLTKQSNISMNFTPRQLAWRRCRIILAAILRR